VLNFGTTEHVMNQFHDCEGLEIDVLRGAERFLHTGLFAVEAESNLKLNSMHDLCHFAELYKVGGPLGFGVYDVYYYRARRPPMSSELLDRGRPDPFDFLFLRGFGTDDDQSKYTVDEIIKRAIIAELLWRPGCRRRRLARANLFLAARIDIAQALRLLASSR
jgi:hypothetical protein